MTKAFVVSLAALAISTSSYSQVTVQPSVEAGALFSSVKSKTDAEEFDGAKGRFSFKAGVGARIAFNESIGFWPELNYVNKGGKASITIPFGVGNIGESKIDSKTSLNFLELPLNFIYSIDAGNGNFFVGAGPVFSFGIGGKAKATTRTRLSGVETVESSETKIKFDGKENSSDTYMHYNRVEIGADLLVGYQIENGFYAKIYYNQGISNLSPVNNVSFRTSYAGISIGFLFGGQK